jgi:hypothetical protein
MVGKMTRTKHVMVRFTPQEYAHIHSIVKANTGTVSEFVRMCVNTSLAQQGDPEAYDMLTKMLSEGMQKVVALKVKAAMKGKK